METFTGYIPKVRDRVRVLAHPDEQKRAQLGESYVGQVGRVHRVAPSLSNCQVIIDGHEDWGYPWLRLFPGEVEPETTAPLAD